VSASVAGSVARALVTKVDEIRERSHNLPGRQRSAKQVFAIPIASFSISKEHPRAACERSSSQMMKRCRFISGAVPSPALPDSAGGGTRRRTPAKEGSGSTEHSHRCLGTWRELGICQHKKSAPRRERISCAIESTLAEKRAASAIYGCDDRSASHCFAASTCRRRHSANWSSTITERRA
jgi:hypothetical protein